MRFLHLYFSLVSRRSLLFALLLIQLFLIPPGLRAAYIYWDGSGGSLVTDGSGTWSNSGGTNWFLPGTGPGAWINNDSAVFGANSGAAGAITVSGTVTAQSLTFFAAGSGSYTLSGGTISLSTAGISSNDNANIEANVNATIGSTLAGSSGLSLAGGATLTLTGSNSYTGTTTITLSTLTLDTATGSLQQGGALTMNGGTFNVDNTGATAAYSGSLGALTFNSGDGTIAITETVPGQGQALTFSSLAARVAGATGNFVNGNAVNSATSGFVLTGATPNSFINYGEFYGGANYAWYDSGGFVRAINYGVDPGSATSGATTSLASGTYQQTTGSVSAQTTASFTTLNLTGNSNFTLNTGATVTVNGLLASGSTVSTISGGTGIQAGSGAEMVIRTDSTSDALTINSNILANGANALTKSGAGTLTLGGTGNWTGTTYLDGGTLSLTNTNALAGGGNLTFDGGTLQYNTANANDYSSKIVNSLGPVSINTNSQNVTFGTALAASNSGGLTKSGAGTLTLGVANNSYTGNTTVNGGTLKSGASYAFTDTPTIVNSGGTLDLNNSTQQIGSLSGAGSVISSSGTSNLFINGASGAPLNNTFSGTLTGAYLDYRAANSVWNLTGSDQFVTNGGADAVHLGAGQNSANASTVNITGTVNSGGNFDVLYGSANVNVNGGVLNLNGANTTVYIAYDDISNNLASEESTFTLNSGSIYAPLILNVVTENNPSATVSATSYNVTTNINLNGGTLTTALIEQQSVLQAPITLTMNGGAIKVQGANTLFADSGVNDLAVQIGNNGGTINLNGFATTSQRPLMNVAGQQGNLAINGPGSVQLSGSGNFSGRTTITSGTVTIGNDYDLGQVGSPTSNQLELNGATLNMNAVLTSATTFTITTSGSSATITTVAASNAPGSFLKVSNDILSLAGGLGGSGLSSTGISVVVTAPDMPGGVQATASAIITNGSVTGYTIINPGSGYSVRPAIDVQLNSGATGTLPSANPTIAYYGLSGSQPTIYNEGTVTNNTTPTLSFANLGTSAVTGAAVTTSTSLVMQANRGIQLDSGGGVFNVATYTGGFTATINGPITGAGALTKAGAGTLVLGASDNYQGGTTINNGILNFGNINALGTGGVTFSGNSTLQAGLGGVLGNNIVINPSVTGTFDTMANAVTLGGTVSGSGVLAKAGSGTLTLSNSNSYSGGTQINGGILALANSGALGSSGNITFGGGTLQYSTANTIDYSSRIGTSGSAIAIDTNGQNIIFNSAFAGASSHGITKNGAGTLTLSGNNSSLTGAITINGGTLQQGAGQSNAWTNNNSADTMYIASGATYDLNGNNDNLWIYNLSGSGVITNSSPTEASQLIAGTSGTTTFAGSFLSGVGKLDIDYRANPSPAQTLILTGSSSINNFYIENNSPGSTVILGAGGYMGLAGSMYVGPNSNGDLLYVNGGYLNLATGQTLRIGWNGSGGVILNSGTISADYVNRSGGNTTSSYLTLNGGVLNARRIGQNDTSASYGMTLTINGATIVVTAADTLFYTAGYAGASGSNELLVQISGSGAFINTNGFNSSSTRPIQDVAGQHGALTKLGAGTFTLSSTNTYTGATSVNGGTLKLDFTAANTPATNIVSGSSALNLGGGTLLLNGNASTTNSQSFNGLTVTAGTNSIQLTAASSNPLLLKLGGVTRNPGAGIVDFTLPSGTQSASNGVVTTSTNTNGILGGWATVSGTDWASVTSGSNIVGLSAAGGYDLSSTAANTASNYLNGNIDMNSSQGPGTIAANSLRFNTAGAETLTVTGTSTITSGGILVTGNVGNNLSTITGGVLVSASGQDFVVIQNNTSNGLTIASGIQDNGAPSGLSKFGAGILTLSGSNSYSGGTTLNAGTLNYGNVNALGSGTATFASASTLQAGVSGTVSNAIVISPGVTATFDSQSNRANLSGAISGAGGLAKIGSGGSLTLSASNSYSGGTTLTSGTLQLGNAYALGATTGNLAVNGGTLDLYGNSVTVGLLTGNSGATITTSSNASNTLNVNSASNGTYAGAITNGSGTVALTQAGTGKLTLSGSNGYTGATTVNAGTLESTNANALLNTGAISVNNAGSTLAVNFGGGSDYTAAQIVTLLGKTTFGATTTAFGIDTTNGSGTYGNALTMPAGLTKLGANTLILTASNTYTGATTISAGTLQIGNGGTTGSITSSGNVVDNGALAFNRTDNYGGGFTPVISGTGSLTLTNGMLTLASANTYSGGTTITSGTLQLGNANALGATYGTLAVNGGVLDLNGNTTTVGNLSGNSGTVITTTANGSITLNINNASSSTYAGTIQNGAGIVAVSQVNAGVQTLSGVNTYTGVTSVNAGTLLFAKEVALYNDGTSSWTAANIKASSGGTVAFNVGGTGEFTTGDVATLLANVDGAVSNNGLQAGSAIGFSTANAAGGTFTISNNIQNTTGAGGGAVGLTKYGANTLVLSGTNTNSGVITNNAGTLQFAKESALYGGTTSLWTTTNIKQAWNSTTLAFNVGGPGEFTTGDVTTLLTNLDTTANYYTDSFGFDTTNAAGGTFTIANNIVDTPGGGGSDNGLVKLGPNTLVLTGTDTYTNVTTVSNGTLQIGNGGTTGSIFTTGGVTLSSTSSTLAFNRSDNYGGNFTKVISGAGGVSVASGTLTLTGNNTFTGNVAINGGIVVVNGGSGGTNPNNSFLGNPQTAGRLITVGTNGTLQFTTANDQLGNVSSTLGVQIVVNGGNLVSDGHITTLGQVTLNNGATVTDANGSGSNYGFGFNGTIYVIGSGTSTIAASNGGNYYLNNLGTYVTTVDVASGSTLLVSGPFHNNWGGNASGLTLTDTGTMILSSNNNSYTGNTTINGGAFLLSGNGSLANTAVTVNSTGTFGTINIANAVTNSVAGSLKLNAGAAFTMADGYTTTLNITGASTLAPGSGAKPTLTFDISGTAGDLLNLAAAPTLGEGDTIYVNLAGSSAPSGTYNLIDAPSGLGSGFTLGNTRVTLNGIAYNFSLFNSGTAEQIVIGASGAPTLYWTGGLSSGGNVWNTITSGTTNWDTSAAGGINSAVTPDSVTDVYFSTTSPTPANLTNSLGMSTTINSLNFVGTGAVTISDTNTLTIIAGTANNGISVAGGAGVPTLSVPIVLGGAQNWTNNSANLLSVTGTVNTNGNTLTVNGTGTGNTTISGAITGAGGIIKSGPSTLYLSNSNSYSGGTQFNGGVVSMQAAGAIPASGTMYFNGGMLQYNPTGAVTDYSQYINDSGAGPVWIDTNGQNVTLGSAFLGTGTNGFTKNGAGTLTFSGSNPNLTGPITINGGTFKLGAGSGTPGTGDFAPWQNLNTGLNTPLILNSGTFDINGNISANANTPGGGFWVGMLSGSAGTAITNNGSEEGALQFGGGAGQSGTFAGNIVPGAKPLNVYFYGTGSSLTLTGSVNVDQFYMGNNSPGGTIYLNPGAYVGAAFMSVGQNGNNSLLVVNGGNLNISNGTGNINVGWNGTGNSGIILNSGTISAAHIGRSGGSGLATYVTINGGVLNTQQMSNDLNAGNGYTVTLNGGTISSTGNDLLFKDSGEPASLEMVAQIGPNGGTINLNGFTETSQRPLMNITGSNGGTLTVTGGGTLDLTGTGTYNGPLYVSGNSAVRVSRDGNLGVAPGLLSANQVELNGGTLGLSAMLTGATLSSGSGVLTSASSYGFTNAIYGYSTSNVTGAFIKLDNSITALAGGLGGSVTTGTINVAIGAPDMPGGIQATANAIITGGSVTGYVITNPGSGYSYTPTISLNKTGTATVPGNPTFQFALSGSNPVIWSEGIVTGAPTATVTSGYSSGVTVALTTSTSISIAATRGIQLDASGGTLDVGSYPSNFTATVNGPISGVGALTKTSGGELVLTASNSYQGGTTINGGTLQVANVNALGGTAGNLAVNTGTLDLNGYSPTVGALSGSIGGVITTTSGGNPVLTSNGAANGTFAGLIQNGSGTVGLTKAGAGTLTLLSVQPYTGVTNINGGNLALAIAGALSANTNITFGGGTLKYIGNTTDYSSQIVNSSSAVSIDTGNQGVEFYTALAASNSGGLTVLSSSGNGTLTLISPQVYTGPTTITSGALYLGDNTGGDDVPSMATSGILDNALLEFRNVGTDTNTISISGTGTVEMYGSGEEIFSGSNSYSGGTLVNSGVLNYANANALGTGPVTFTGPGTLQAAVSGTLVNSLGANPGVTGTFDVQSNPITLSTGIVGSAGTVAKVGSGTLTLAGSSNYTGDFSINGGLVALASANALGTTGTISFGGAGGTLQYSASNTVDYSSRIGASSAPISIDTNGQNITFASSFLGTNTGGFTKNGAGMLTLGGTNSSLTGTLTVNGGTLRQGSSQPWNVNAQDPLVLNSGTFDINGFANSGLGFLTGNAGTVITNNGGSEAQILWAGVGLTGTYAGTFQNGSALLDINFRGSGGATVTLTGSSHVAQSQFGDASNGTVILGPGSYLSTGFQAVGENSLNSQLIINGGVLALQDPNNGTLRIGWNGTGSSGVTLNSGTITAPFINRSGGSGSSTFLTVNGGVVNTKEIMNDHIATSGMTFTLNGGTINNTNNDTLFMDSGQSAANELLVQIGANGGTINTNGFTTISQRPLMNVSGSSTAGTLTVMGAGSMNLSGTGTYTGNTYITGGGTVKISRDGNLGVAPGSTVANQVEINGGTLNFSSMLTGATMTGGSNVLTSASNYAIGTTGLIGSPTITNMTGAMVKLNNSITALVGGTGANGGNGVSNATVTISPPDLPGGIQATASATVTNGTVTAYTITNPGSGYSYAPLFVLNYAYSGTVRPVTPTYQFALTGSNPVIWSEGIVSGAGAPVLSVSGYASSPTLAVTTSTSVTLASTRGIQLDASGGTLDVSNNPANFTATVNGPVSGVGSLTKTSAGELVLTASNSYQGGTAINGGTLQAANANALGASTGNLAVNAGTLDMDGNSITVGALSGSSGTVITTTAGGTITLTSSSASNTTYAGSIQSGAGTVGLTQAGTGTLKLTGNNTYTGATTINAGTVIVSGSLSGTTSASVASGGTMEIDGLLNSAATTTLNGGTLQGTGSVGGITDNGSSTIAPGMTSVNALTSTGTMTAAGSVTLAATTNFNIRLGFTSGTTGDQLAVNSGNVLLNDANLNLTLGSAMNNPALINTFYAIIVGGAGSTGSGSDVFGSYNGTAIVGNTFITSGGWQFNILYAENATGTGGGNDVVLELTAIPEPGTWATMLSGFGMLLFVQRMRRKARR